MIILKAIVVMLICATIGSYLGKHHFALDIISNFKVHYAAVFFVSLWIFLFSKQPAWLVLSLVGVSINLAVIVPWYVGNDKRIGESGNSIKILISNVAMNRIDHKRLAQLIEEEQPEIFGLVEVSPQVLKDLTINLDEYKFDFKYPTKETNQGLALFSKLRISKANMILFGESATATIVANIEVGEEVVEFILTHPYWPLGIDRGARRNAQLQNMAQHIRGSDTAVIVAGDLNATMWSPYYKDFVAVSGMSNARRGYGVGATFPSRMPVLGIPIDHILISGPSRLSEFQVNKSIGSDHLPISARANVLPRQPR